MRRKVFNICYVAGVVGVLVLGFILFYVVPHMTGLEIVSQAETYEQSEEIELGKFECGILPKLNFEVYAKYSDGSKKKISEKEYSVEYFFRAKDQDNQFGEAEKLDKLPETKEEYLEKSLGRYYLKLKYAGFEVKNMYFSVLKQSYSLKGSFGWKAGEEPPIFYVQGSLGTVLTQEENPGTFVVHYFKMNGIDEGPSIKGIYKNDGTDVLEPGFYMFHVEIFETDAYLGGIDGYILVYIEE